MAKSNLLKHPFISYLAAKSQMPLDHHAGGVPHVRWEESSYCSCQGKRKPLKAQGLKEIWGGATLTVVVFATGQLKGIHYSTVISCVWPKHVTIYKKNQSISNDIYGLSESIGGKCVCPVAGKLSCWCSACFRKARTCFRSPPPWPVECMHKNCEVNTCRLHPAP